LTLYNYIILKKFINPKYKDLYEKGYYIHGHINIDNYIIPINEYTYDKNEANKIIENIIKETQKGLKNE